jgi:hypothetical protein
MKRIALGSEPGFSLTEIVVAAAVILLVVAAALAVAKPALEVAHAQPESVDLQQRARAAAAMLYRDLYAAGAGIDFGDGAGPLIHHIAPVLPRRIGAALPDSPNVARSDVVSVLWVPTTRMQTTLVAPLTFSPMLVRHSPGCPPQPACGTRSGMGLLLLDRSGVFDLLTAEAVAGSGVMARSRGSSGFTNYQDDSLVAELEARTYYVNLTSRQLRRYDTDSTDVPVVDDVVGMAVQYWGSASPPARPRPAIGTANCLYDAGGQPVGGMAVLGLDSDGLAALPVEMFGDGPWCGSGSTRYDADLLRVRRVRVTLRLQASAPSVRGTGSRFALPGISRSATRVVPDLLVSIDVVPRNLMAGE